MIAHHHARHSYMGARDLNARLHAHPACTYLPSHLLSPEISQLGAFVLDALAVEEKDQTNSPWNREIQELSSQLTNVHFCDIVWGG